MGGWLFEAGALTLCCGAINRNHWRPDQGNTAPLARRCIRLNRRPRSVRPGTEAGCWQLASGRCAKAPPPPMGDSLRLETDYCMLPKDPFSVNVTLAESQCPINVTIVRFP